MPPSLASMVRVGLTSYREPAEWGVWSEPADLLPASYADAVAAAGAVPLLLPPSVGPADLEAAAEAAVDGLDGLVLSGGPDVDPARYAAVPDPHTGAPREQRDAWEIALTMAARHRDLPLLGVCRGMQVLAVALGGTLHQHLPDTVGSEAHSPTGRRPRSPSGEFLAGQPAGSGARPADRGGQLPPSSPRPAAGRFAGDRLGTRRHRRSP